MKIRDLKWKKRTIEDALWYESDIFNYSVERMGGGWMAWKDNHEVDSYDTKELAMEYCQQDFEKVVKKCLVND